MMTVNLNTEAKELYHISLTEVLLVAAIVLTAAGAGTHMFFM